MLIIVTCLIVCVCRGNLAFKCHWILSKLIEIATSIYLFLMSGMNFSLELSDYWAFLLVHAACKLQSVVVIITASLLFVANKANKANEGTREEGLCAPCPQLKIRIPVNIRACV